MSNISFHCLSRSLMLSAWEVEWKSNSICAYAKATRVHRPAPLSWRERLKWMALVTNNYSSLGWPSLPPGLLFADRSFNLVVGRRRRKRERMNRIAEVREAEKRKRIASSFFGVSRSFPVSFPHLSIIQYYVFMNGELQASSIIETPRLSMWKVSPQERHLWHKLSLVPLELGFKKH